MRQQSKLVVRLKGGDVSIFSNILDELQVLQIINIAYEIVPGITAALGASAYAGNTAYCKRICYCSKISYYYKSDVVTEEYWKELANTNDTLVFYMSADTLDRVVDQLLKNNVSGDKKIAIIGQATTTEQKVVTCSFDEYSHLLKGAQHISPTIVIIGKVVTLNEQFAWIKNNESPKEYFKALAQPGVKNHLGEIHPVSIK